MNPLSMVCFVAFEMSWLVECLQSALFNFQSLLAVILLVICTCAYIRAQFPALLDRNKTGYSHIDNHPRMFLKYAGFWACSGKQRA